MKNEKLYAASVRNENGEIKYFEGYAANLKNFKYDLRVNGYKVRFATTPEKFDEACERYHEKLESKKRCRKMLKMSEAELRQYVYGA